MSAAALVRMLSGRAKPSSEAFRCTSSTAGRPFQELKYRPYSVAQSSERSQP